MPSPSNPTRRTGVRHLAASFAVGVMLWAGAAPSRAQAPDVELYDQPQFNGVRLTLSADAPDLAAYGLSGRVASLVVRRGQWEFCTHAQYSGACITVGPGRYGDLPAALRGTLASVRNASAVAGGRPTVPPPAPYPQSPQSPPPPLPPQARPPVDVDAVVLWERADFSGNRLGVSAANPRLSNQAFNDTANAVDIYRGRWQLCQHADYNGECVVLAPGRYVLSGRLANGLTSLRPVFGGDNRPMPSAGGVVLYEHGDFQGRELVIHQATANLAALNFNDRSSAVEVLGGRWELCTDAEYSGRCIVLGPGRHQLERGMNDRISSVRPR